MFKKEVVKILKSVGLELSENNLEIPPQAEFGDLAFPCFELAKKEKKSPQEIAEVLTKKIKISKNDLIAKAEARAGYINFFYNYEKISEIVLKQILKEKSSFGKLKIGKGKKNYD